jgi:large repetitive protein
LAAGTISHLGLPNFRQQTGTAFGGPGFTFTNLCLGDSVKFAGTSTDPIDKFQWTFGDGTSSPFADNKPTPAHLYAKSGNYTVVMDLQNRCTIAGDAAAIPPTTHTVPVYDPPAKPTLPPTDFLCLTGTVRLEANKNNVAGLTYLWSDQTKSPPTPTFRDITEQSIVSVTATDVHGCSTPAQTLVSDNRPGVLLPPDQTVCQNSIVAPLDPVNPANTVTWNVDGVDVYTGPARTQAVNTTVIGVHTYKVTITDPNGCTAIRQTVFTVTPSPIFTFTGVNATGACGSNNGSLLLTLQTNGPATDLYEFSAFGPGLNQFGVDKLAGQSFPFPGLAGGTYTALVTNQLSNCQTSQSFVISDTQFSFNAAALAPNCDPVTVSLTLASGSATGPLQYTATPNVGVPIGPVTGFASFPISTTPLKAGVYSFQVKDAAGCTAGVNNFAVTPNAPVTVTIEQAVCNTPPTITASGATSYTWTGGPVSGPGSITGSNLNPTLTLTAGVGTFTYTVVGIAAGSCPNTQAVNVTLDNPTVDFTQSNACASNVTLTATPATGYTYRWYKGGVLQAGLLGRSISVGLSENGASYQVEAFNQLNGCGYRSAPKTLQVIGAVDAGLSATPACEDGKPFTLTSTTVATGVTYAWFKNNTAIAGLTTPTISQTDVGTYKVEISKSVCKATATASIIRSPLPVGKLPNRLIICNDPENKDPLTNQTDLDPGKFASYNWFKNELTLNYTSQIFTATSQGKYRVDLTNSFGCVAPDETEVRNECIPKIEAPNAFRPGSTLTENKDFYVFSFFIKDENFQVFLYNRWGELVYTSSDRFFKWNGGFNNSASQPLPGGSYAYVIRYQSSFHPERGVLEKRGGVALLR